MEILYTAKIMLNCAYFLVILVFIVEKIWPLPSLSSYLQSLVIPFLTLVINSQSSSVGKNANKNNEGNEGRNESNEGNNDLANEIDHNETANEGNNNLANEIDRNEKANEGNNNLENETANLAQSIAGNPQIDPETKNFYK